jgi:putative hydrolase of HD superfamily
VKVDEAKAVRELTEGLFFGDDIRRAIEEFNAKETQESKVARDADQIALILQLKEYGDLGNKYSDEWIKYALQRLYTEEGKELAARIIQTDSTHWWFKDKSDWWINGSNR